MTTSTRTPRRRFTKRNAILVGIGLLALAGFATYRDCRGLAGGSELGGPCAESADCHGSPREVRCLSASDGHYCTRRCQTDADCGEGFTCGEAEWTHADGEGYATERACLRR